MPGGIEQNFLWEFDRYPKAKKGLDVGQQNNMLGLENDRLRWLTVFNYSLPSNQYSYKNLQTLSDFTEQNMSLFEQLTVLFNHSLPDIFTELRDAIQNKKYSSIPTALITVLFNTPLKIFHIVSLVAQVFFEVLSTPTRLMNIAFNAMKNSTSTLGKTGFGSLTIALAIVTSPFQLCGLVANSMGYARQVADGAVTLAKLVVTAVVNLPALVWDLQTKLYDNIGSKAAYAAKNFAINVIQLLPAACIVAAGVLTGGFSFIAANLAAMAGASTATISGIAAAVTASSTTAAGITATAIASTAAPLAAVGLMSVFTTAFAWGSQFLSFAVNIIKQKKTDYNNIPTEPNAQNRVPDYQEVPDSENLQEEDSSLFSVNSDFEKLIPPTSNVLEQLEKLPKTSPAPNTPEPENPDSVHSEGNENAPLISIKSSKKNKCEGDDVEVDEEMNAYQKPAPN